MPRKMWIHKCGNYHDTIVWRGVEVCPDCGIRANYDGWHFSMIEEMAAYQHRTSLKPVGQHRPLADRLLDPYMHVCAQCLGKGLIDINDGGDWKICPACKGAEYLFGGDKEEFDALRKEILIAFPDCEA